MRSKDAPLLSLACEATDLCSTPFGMVSIIEPSGQRFLACVGMEARTIERHVSLCAHTIHQAEPLAAEDTFTDPRFRDNPFVVGEPFIRFYAGAPILDEGGLPLGSVCVTDTKPHEISSKCLLALARLAEVAGAVLETHLAFDRPRRPDFQARLDAPLLTLVASRPRCD